LGRRSSYYYYYYSLPELETVSGVGLAEVGNHLVVYDHAAVSVLVLACSA
jgi:hypothetical protein